MKKFVFLSLIAAALAMPVALVSTASSATDAPATPAVTEVKSEAKILELKDGTKVEVLGEAVSVIGKDGNKTPAPDGTHELKDGSKVTTKGGKIVK